MIINNFNYLKMKNKQLLKVASAYNQRVKVLKVEVKKELHQLLLFRINYVDYLIHLLENNIFDLVRQQLQMLRITMKKKIVFLTIIL